MVVRAGKLDSAGESSSNGDRKVARALVLWTCLCAIVGIDLGTTNSCVAVYENGEVVVIPKTEGARTTPSMVGFTESSERLVGQIAKRQAITNPANTIYSVKRLIGRRFDSTEVRTMSSNRPFESSRLRMVTPGSRPARRSYSPAEISAMVLSRLKQTVEDYMGSEIERAVITVPAYFNDAQRQATETPAGSLD